MPSATIPSTRPADTEQRTRIIDCDVHPSTNQPELEAHLPSRWKEYLNTVGRRNMRSFGLTTAARPLSSRKDTVPLGGGVPGSDPDLARKQLLDGYGIDFAVLNCMDVTCGGGAPLDFELSMARAVNDHIHQNWLSHDPRWASAIAIVPDQENGAVAEIERCRNLSDRFVHVITDCRNERPAGNPKYWPIYEVCAEAGLPLAVHLAQSRYNQWTGVGQPSYYYEVHIGNSTQAEAMVASMIFEGIFDHFPKLKVSLIELGWAWAFSFGWRLDATWRVLRDEVSHLQRKPSDYLRENFWFSTQPVPEPEEGIDPLELYEQLEGAGMINQLVYSSDYPHWDMDAPETVLPGALSRESKEKVLSKNALALYGLSEDERFRD